MKKLYLYTFLVFMFSFSILADECIEGNCTNGIGTLLTSSGDKYIGEWRDNNFYGGIFISADGDSQPAGCIEGECNTPNTQTKFKKGSFYCPFFCSS